MTAALWFSKYPIEEGFQLPFGKGCKNANSASL